MDVMGIVMMGLSVIGAFLVISERMKKQAKRKAAEERNAVAPEVQADSLEALVGELNHEDWRVRLAAVEVLVNYEDEAVLPHLIAGLHDEDGDVREAASKQLIRVGRPAAPHLYGLLDESEQETRIIAIHTLAQIGDQKAVGEFIEAMDDVSAWVRIAAAEALGKLKVARAVPTLIKALKDEDQGVRVAAKEALERIGSKRAQDAVRAYADR